LDEPKRLGQRSQVRTRLRSLAVDPPLYGLAAVSGWARRRELPVQDRDQLRLPRSDSNALSLYLSSFAVRANRSADTKRDG